MAEPDSTGGNSSFGFLAKKLGPLPVWLWALIALGGYYWYTHYGPGAATAATTTTAAATSAPASAPSVTGSQYKNNTEWEAAALNYLVGESVPPDQASAALYNYLHSQSLTAQQQKDVNLAIEGIGPPPNIPAPAPVEPKPKAPGPKPKPKPLPNPPSNPKPKPTPPVTLGGKPPNPVPGPVKPTPPVP